MAGTGEARELSFLVDEAFGDETCFEFPYGPRVFHAGTVLEIAATLKALPDSVVAERLTLERLEQVYPFTIRRPDREDITRLLAHVSELRDFVDAAAHAQECLMVAVD
ncbi:MAG: DUF1877 family protein [Myxococcales bacterium]|nr:DUF1877 family protein [Myxococcales bacterium]